MILPENVVIDPDPKSSQPAPLPRKLGNYAIQTLNKIEFYFEHIFQ